MKKFRVEISPKVQDDLLDAMEYYDKISRTISLNLYVDFKNTINTLSLNPYLQIRYNAIRCASLSTFPFMLHFRIDETERLIIVYALIHTSRDPKKSWIK